MIHWTPSDVTPAGNMRVMELECALHIMAYIVVTHGEVYGPILARVESELDAARKASSYSDRAAEILAKIKTPQTQPASSTSPFAPAKVLPRTSA